MDHRSTGTPEPYATGTTFSAAAGGSGDRYDGLVRVIIFGATGMVGQGVRRESLLAADVEEVLSVGRRPTGVQHRKLREA